MKLKVKVKKNYKKVIRKRFAFLPININGDIRWLEFVKIKGYWLQLSGNWYWTSLKFVE